MQQVSNNEFNKYFNNTWSYVGTNGLSIDGGTWLISYYVWISAQSNINFISIKSTIDDVVGATAPCTTYGSFLEMHEIVSNCAIDNLFFFVYVPSPVTIAQISYKLRAIKLK